MPQAVELGRIRCSHQLFHAPASFSLSLCTCHTSLNTFCHGALSAARMLSLMPRCLINYLILVQLGSHHLWSGSGLTFLCLLWLMEKQQSVEEKEKKETHKKKKKGELKNGMWTGKQSQLTAGRFCHTEAYSLLNVTSFQTLKFPSSPLGAAVTQSCQDEGETDCLTDNKSRLLTDQDLRQITAR